MKKKTDATVTTTVETAVTAAVATSGKGGKGIPRVNNGVRSMTPEAQEKWFSEKCSGLSAEVQAQIRSRLTEAPKTAKGRKVDFAAAFAGMTVSALKEVRTAIDSAIAAAVQAEEDNLNRIIAKAEQEKARLIAERETVNG